MSAHQIKGSTLATKFEFVGERFGDHARLALEARFAGRDLFPIAAAAWYDYDLYIEVLEEIARRHFDGNLAGLVVVGAYSANQALSTSYQAFIEPTGFVDFLRGVSRLHRLFYARGDVEVTIDEPACRAEIVQRDQPRYAEADLFVASGFFEKAADLHGRRGIACGFSVEPDGAHFDLSWE
jgi:hypothetical protein